MFNNMPIMPNEPSRELMPALINGSGVPVFGSSMVATPIFTKL
jgi:hypothetical protein